MKWILAAAMGVFALGASAPALAIDFRGTDDNGVLWGGCKSRAAPPEGIIRSCAWALKSGLGTSASRTYVEYIANALYRMGVAYRRSGNTELSARHFDLAIQAMNQAVAGSPNDATMRKGRCWFKAVQNTNLNGALADCDAALKMDPDNASIVEYRGFTLYRLSRYQEALDAYSAALSSKSDNPDAQFMRGTIKRKLGDIAGGDSDIAAAKREDSHMDQIYLSYGVGD